MGQFGRQHDAVLHVVVFQRFLRFGLIDQRIHGADFQRGFAPQRDTGITQIQRIDVQIFVLGVSRIFYIVTSRVTVCIQDRFLVYTSLSVLTEHIGRAAVVANPGEGDLARTGLDAFDTGTSTGDVPVVEVGDVDIVTLVVTLTGPQGGFRREAQQALGLHVELTQGEVGVAVALLGIEVTDGAGTFPIVGAVGRHGEHGVYVESLAIFVEDFLTQLNFAVGIIFVTQTTNLVHVVFHHVAVTGNADT